MAVRILFLAALLCVNATAFVIPWTSRTLVSRVGTDHFVAAACASGASNSYTRTARPHMRYVAMNRFKVKLGCEDEFETIWRERESSLASFSGFEQFMLLKADSGEQNYEAGEASANRAGYTEFISHTVWTHQMDYDAWKKSQAFKKSHGAGSEGGKPSYIAAGGMNKIGDLIVERPTPALFDAVIIEPVPPEHQGGLWEFENEPSYYDGDI